MREQRCNNCRFWSRNYDAGAGMDTGGCRIGRPLLVTSAVRVDQYGTLTDGECERCTRWPTTHEEDWCGEWQAEEGKRAHLASAVSFAEFVADFQGDRVPNILRCAGITDWPQLFDPHHDPATWRNCGDGAMERLLAHMAKHRIPAPSHWTITRGTRQFFVEQGGKFQPHAGSPPRGQDG